MEEKRTTQAIIGCAIKIHTTLGPGFLESVYQNALVHELKMHGLSVETGKLLPVYYDGVVVGEFCPDLIVANRIVVELKAIQALNAAHEVQLVNYLTALRLDLGLLINFGGKSLEFKRKHRLYVPPSNNPPGN